MAVRDDYIDILDECIDRLGRREPLERILPILFLRPKAPRLDDEHAFFG